jgi:hypothetical protein
MNIPAETQNNINTALARLADLTVQDNRVQGILKTLAEAGQEEASVQQKLGAIDQTEREAMAAWAAAGAKGKAPVFDHGAREALNRELLEAKAKATAAAAAAQTITSERDVLQSQMQEAGADLKVHALTALASHAQAYGDAYRQALIDVERNRIFLNTLNLFLAGKQDLNDRRTTAFATPVSKILEQRDLFMEPIKLQALNEANEHWARLFSSFLRPSPTPAQPAKAAA